MAKGPSWAPSSGVGFIPGDGRPTPGDMINMAEEQAELDRLTEKAGTTLHVSKAELPDLKIKGIKLSYPTTLTKAEK
jgi:hypothetical protein